MRQLGLRPRPGDDGNYRRLQAIDLATREAVWTTRQRSTSRSSSAKGAFTRSFAPLVPEFCSPPNRGATLWVFALPG